MTNSAGAGAPDEGRGPTDPRLGDEQGRLRALHRLEILDTPPEQPFDRIVGLVRTVIGVPIAAVTLIDDDRQWFKAIRGVEAAQTTRIDSFCTHTIREREPLVVEDAPADPRFAGSALVLGAPNIRSYAGVPLRTPDGYALGSLCAIDTRPRRFSAADIEMLGHFARIVENEIELRLIARRDFLTGVLTRRGFVDHAEAEIERHARYERMSSLAILDIDCFKPINDAHGHAAGDLVLQQLAALCQSMLRPTDLFGRLGGEEFGILMPETPAMDALAAAERFRLGIEQHRFAIPGNDAFRITASFGVAALDPSLTTVDSWLAAADSALYRAKQDGRNRSDLA